MNKPYNHGFLCKRNKLETIPKIPEIDAQMVARNKYFEDRPKNWNIKLGNITWIKKTIIENTEMEIIKVDRYSFRVKSSR